MMVGKRLLITGFLLALVLSVGTSAYASTVWNPAGNGIYPPATGTKYLRCESQCVNSIIVLLLNEMQIRIMGK